MKYLLIAILLLCGCQTYKGKSSNYWPNGNLKDRTEFSVYIVGTTAMRDDLTANLANFGTITLGSSEITPEKFAEILRESTPFLEAFRAVTGGL